jgi:hypothetical protein
MPGNSHLGSTPNARAKKARRPKLNPQLAKLHLPYKVADIARLYGVHQNTVFAWIESGLATIDEIRPFIILGRELRSFLQRRSNTRRVKCGVGELYCCGCKTPRRPAGDTVDFELTSPTLGNLVGICPVCESIMNQRANPANLESICADLEILVRSHCDT